MADVEGAAGQDQGQGDVSREAQADGQSDAAGQVEPSEGGDAAGQAASSEQDAAGAGEGDAAPADQPASTEEDAAADVGADQLAAPPDASGEVNADGEPYGQADEDGNVAVVASFMDVMDEVDYTPEASFSLPAGCVPYVSCDGWAAVVQANTDGRTFTRLGCLDLSTGDYTVLLEEGLTGRGYAVSEARITDQLVCWVEVDNSSQAWALYACRFTAQPITLGSAGLVKLGEGDADWLTPQFDAAVDQVVWQVMPDPAGPDSKEHSHAYLWTLGSSQGDEVFDSPGRFACAPAISGGVLTVTPRVKADEGVYYAPTALSMSASHAQLDQLVMPASVKPFFATYTGSGFAFSVEADYGYGGRLGCMGYYIGPGEGPFHYVLREPSAQICQVGGLYVVKSRMSYFVVDLRRLTYARISAASGCTDYGDYPATQGTVNRFVTFATIKDATSGVPSSVLVRIFSLS